LSLKLKALLTPALIQMLFNFKLIMSYLYWPQPNNIQFIRLLVHNCVKAGDQDLAPWWKHFGLIFTIDIFFHFPNNILSI